jgi:penicillin amidase
MSSAPASLSKAPPAAKRRNFLRFLLALLLIATLAGGAAMAAFVVLARRALPQVEGTLAVAGLEQQVTITRDLYGVPHIAAAGLEDLFFAQGFVTAQDRLWQMDMLRRFAAGELAEVLGPSALTQDRQRRILQLDWVARRAAENLPQPERAYFDAYARGVNAYITSREGNLPLEFRVLRYRPQPWTPRDSILVATYMAEMLAGSLYLTEVGRERILERLGPELTAELYPESSERDRPPTWEARRLVKAHAARPGAPPRQPNLLLPAPPAADEMVVLAPGSNNWVVSGAHTASGRPLLSNDMHLPHGIPGIWYRAHLQAGDFDVTGFTLPGMPFVIVGHNRRIAWGFTNIGPDVQDVFIETFNDQGEYLTASGWQAPERRREVIRVKGQADVVLEVTVTGNGPVITELIPGETRALALRWTLYEPDTIDSPFFQVNAAGDWEQFRQGFARFHAPAQNVVYADVEGNIGYQATGRVPIRRGGSAGSGEALPVPADGTLPAPGHDPRYQWTGYVPYDELPRVYNPPSGLVATANGRIMPPGYRHHLGAQWAPAYRTERIYQVLEAGGRFTSADMLRLQLDVYSDLDRILARRFAQAVERTPGASPRARAAAGLMREWDGFLTAESAAATIAVSARARLGGMLLEPRLGELRQRYRWFMASVWLENTVQHEPAHWLPEGYESYDALLASAVEAAVTSEEAPANLADWRYGRAFPVELQHAVWNRVPLVRRWAAPGVLPQAGSGGTVKAAGRRFGASQRMTVDLADLDKTTMNILTGQSGQLLSPHYLDHWPAWYGGTTFPAPFSPSAVQRTRKHTLTLEPAP